MSLDELKLKGNEAFKAEKYEDAIMWYTKAIEANPNSEDAAPVYSNRAICWQRLDNLPKTLEDSEMCILLRPSWFKGYFRKGMALLGMKKYDEALTACQKALSIDSGNEELMGYLQNLNTLLKERNEKATPAACDTATEAKTIGNSLFTSGKYERAALFYARAIALSKDNMELANCYANRAACHQQTHSYRDVVDDCNKALELYPTHVKAFIRRAVAYEGLEKWSKALDDYNHVNRLSPGIPCVSQGILRCNRVVRG